jgi:hypothetical protein
MKTIYFLMAMLLLSNVNVNAQFIDDMEYPDGVPDSSDWWTCWVDGSECGPLIVGPGAGHESDYSGYIPGDGITDVVLDLGNKIFGEWGLEFYMYIPSGKTAYWNLQGEVPVGAGEWIVGNIFFNQDIASPGVGSLDDTALGEVTFNFPHDEWFRIAMNFDISSGISAATWGMSVDNIIAVPEGTAFTNEAGSSPTSLGGVNYYSITLDNEYNIDSFNYMDDFFVLEPIAGVNDNAAFEFSIFPNPSNGIINIQSEIAIEELNIYSLQGILIESKMNIDRIDISHLSSGIYFIEALSEKRKSVQKLIKK